MVHSAVRKLPGNRYRDASPRNIATEKVAVVEFYRYRGRSRAKGAHRNAGPGVHFELAVHEFDVATGNGVNAINVYPDLNDFEDFQD
jgi:hypothetical protein